MSDPVASKSSFLCTYMQSHPDTLQAYAMFYGKVKPVDSSVKMLSIDSKKFVLQYLDRKTRSVKTVDIDFDPALEGYDEVRPRLLQMKLEADSALQIEKRPTISQFSINPKLTTFTLSMIAFYFWVYFSHPSSAFQDYPGRWLAFKIYELAGGALVKGSGIFMVITHFFEALYQAFLCRKRSDTSWPLTALWCATTFVSGFAGLVEFKRVLANARIASIKSQ